VTAPFMDVGQIPFYTVANTLGALSDELSSSRCAAVVMPMATKLNTEDGPRSSAQSSSSGRNRPLSLTLLTAVPDRARTSNSIRVVDRPSFEGLGGNVLQILMFSALVLPSRSGGRGAADPHGAGQTRAADHPFWPRDPEPRPQPAPGRSAGPRGSPWVPPSPTRLFALAVLVFRVPELKMPLTHYVQSYVCTPGRPRRAAGPALLLWFRRASAFTACPSWRPGGRGAGVAMMVPYARDVDPLPSPKRSVPRSSRRLARLRSGSRA